ISSVPAYISAEYMQNRMRDKSLSFVLIILCVISLTRIVDSPDYWVVDLLSHFPIQYAMAAFILLLICLRKKLFSLAVLSGLLMFFNLGALNDSAGTVQASRHPGSTFLVYSGNLHIFNHDISKLNSELQKMAPDIVLLLEMTADHHKQIQPVMESYPFHIEQTLSQEKGIGFLFLSKFPIIDKDIKKLSSVCNFLLTARLEINQKPVVFYGFHAQRPGIQNHNERRDQFLFLAREIKKQTLPVIVSGDFNATPFSPTFRQLVGISGLRDSRAGFGWQPSWPSYFPPLWIPIDHMLVSRDIIIHNRATGSYFGSDHYPIFAELSINN
ncbi:MAG: endonuclease/exonuclease/phosphatase family protein, partial [Nitrospirota bacterium]